MPPAKKKECSVVVFDVNSKEEYKSKALKTYVDICSRKFFQDSDDLCQLVLANSAKTDNVRNRKSSGECKNVEEATGVEIFNPKHKRLIEEAEPAEGNWLDGVLVGVDILEKMNDERGIYSLQLLVLSDLTTPIKMDDKTLEYLLDYISSKVNELYIYLFILGPEVIIPSMLTTKKDVCNWIQKLKFADKGKDSNYSIAKRLVKESSGVMCDLEIGIELYSFYKRPKGKNAWIVPLTYDDLEIPSSTTKVLDPQSVVKPTQNTEGIAEIIYVNAEDESKIVEGPFVDGIAMYDKLVVIPDDVDKGIKEYDRFFKLFGFTEAFNIPEHYMMSSSTNEVLVDVARDRRAKALEYLIRATHKLGCYGVALKAHMKNTRPKLYCLIPEINDKSETDIHSAKTEEVSEELKENVYGFLNSLDAEGKYKLHPSVRSNAYNNKIIGQLSAKYLGGEITQSKLSYGELAVEPSAEYAEKLQSTWIEADPAGGGTEEDDSMQT